MPDEAATCTRRLFFALWPDASTRRLLARAARDWSHHPVAAENLHMTLHFLGACSAEEQRCYIDSVSGILFKPFDINMDYLGSWPRSGIQWLGVSQAPEALGRLVASLGEALAACGYRPDKRHFVPHVTLSRKEKNPRTRAGLPPLRWRVNELVLAESVAVDGGVRYRVRERWRARE